MHYLSRQDLENVARAGRAKLSENVVRMNGNFWLEVDPNDTAFTPWAISDGFWEAWVATAIARELHEAPPGTVFVDAGANVGYYTMMAAAGGNEVLAFEPIPHVCEMLYRSVNINGFARNVSICNEALSDESGWLKMHVYPEHTGGSHLSSDGDTEVYVSVLDEYLHQIKELFADHVVLKVDVEGNESKVWGGSLLLRRSIPTTWFVEWVPERDTANSRDWLAEVSETHKIHWVSYSGELEEMSIDQCMDMTFETLCFKNK